MVLMLLGIGLFGAITAMVTSYLIATGGTTTSDDPMTRLRELARLREDGIIGDAEFEATKSILLTTIGEQARGDL